MTLGRVCPGVSAGVSHGVSVGILDTLAETPTLVLMIVQVSGGIYLSHGDPVHGINHDPAQARGRKARRLVPHATPIAPPRR